MITIGVVEVLKRAFGLETKLLPLTGLVTALILVALGVWTGLTDLPILAGVVVGLSAAGLYDQKKIATK